MRSRKDQTVFMAGFDHYENKSRKSAAVLTARMGSNHAADIG